MVPEKHLIDTGDTVRFLQHGRWRFAVVTKVGRKWLHVTLDDRTAKVPVHNARLWSKHHARP